MIHNRRFIAIVVIGLVVLLTLMGQGVEANTEKIVFRLDYIKDETIFQPTHGSKPVIDHAFIRNAISKRYGKDDFLNDRNITERITLKAPFCHIKTLWANVDAETNTIEEHTEEYADHPDAAKRIHNSSGKQNNERIDDGVNVGRGERHLFLLKSLERHALYEARVSWTAATPAEFGLNVHKILNDTEVKLNPPSKHEHYRPPYYYVLEVIVEGTGVILYTPEDEDDKSLKGDLANFKQFTEKVVLVLGSLFILPMVLSIFGDKSYLKVEDLKEE